MNLEQAATKGREAGAALTTLYLPDVAVQHAYSLASDYAEQNCHGLSHRELTAMREAFFNAAVGAIGSPSPAPAPKEEPTND